MRSKYQAASDFLSRLPAITVSAIAILSFLSWIGCVYEWGMRNILSAEGIRWSIGNIINNFNNAPVTEILLFIIGLSVVAESGLFEISPKHISLKQRRALFITAIAQLLSILVIVCLTFLPNSILLSAFGTITHSSFAKGLPGLIFILSLIAGNFYGYTSGRFVTIKDMMNAHVALLKNISTYLLTMFTLSELIGCMSYTNSFRMMCDILSIQENNIKLFTDIFTYSLYLLPLTAHIVLAYKVKDK